MSNTTVKLPPTVTKITINAVDYVADGNGEISVPSADLTTAIKQSEASMSSPSIKCWVSKPPTNPAT